MSEIVINDRSLWLQSYKSLQKNATQKICITSGKGGVGKTSIALKLASLLSEMGNKVLVIDCDFNLSNTSVKLGIPLGQSFYDLLNGSKTFDQCLYKMGNMHLLGACNGDPELYERALDLSGFFMDVIAEHEKDYDYIILDSPAGIGRDNLVLNAYCDMRVVVVTPDKSSLTDSYSLVKILSLKHEIHVNHLLVNQVSTLPQYQRIVRSMTDTVDQFLQGQMRILGGVSKFGEAVDHFDQTLLKNAESKIHKNFLKVVGKLVDECERQTMSARKSVPVLSADDFGQEV
jgi:flagellar biosynthesis protein FlhG